MNIIEFILDLDWKKIVESILSALLASGIIGGFGYLVTKKITRDFRIAKEMKSYGFKGVVAKKKHSTREIKKLCKDTKRLDLLFISGIDFFSENRTVLENAMNNGMKIRFLCSQIYTNFLSDLEELEDKEGVRKSDTNISIEIEDVTKKYSKYIESGQMEIRYYSTQYRLPFILVYKRKKNMKTTKAFLRVTLPPYNWETNFVLIGERKTTKKDDFFKTNNDEIDFISMIEKHFDCVWEVADREIDRKQEIKNTNFEVKS